MYIDHLHSMSGNREITNQDRLIGGGISGVVATVFCIPLDTVSALTQCSRITTQYVFILESIKSTEINRCKSLVMGYFASHMGIVDMGI